MRLAKALVLTCALAMGATLIYGFTRGDFAADGSALLANPWGVVSLVDVYVGFTLFCGWIIFRERSLLVALLWTVSIMVLGFFLASVYALIALQQSAGDWQAFWLGHRAPVS
jgi:hypothetical protein